MVEAADVAGMDVRVRRIDFVEKELFILAEGDWRSFRSHACAKEPETVRWIQDAIEPGSVFYDIGACVGSYAIVASSLGAVVNAFEPVAVNFAQLQQNAWLNRLEGLRAWPVALTAETGPLELSLSTPAAGAASHRMSHRGPAKTLPLTALDDAEQYKSPATDIEHRLTQATPGFALDDFVRMFGLPQPEHIKIDVDGQEVDVLEGARSVLHATQTVMVEADPDSTPAVTAILTAAGLEAAGSWPRSGRQRNYLFKRA